MMKLYRRLKSVDVPTALLKAAPDFCTVYVISKTKLSSIRNASRHAPFTSPLYDQIYQANNNSNLYSRDNSQSKPSFSIRGLYFFPFYIKKNLYD